MTKPDPVIKRMMRRFEDSSQAEAHNRKRGLVALKFRQGGKDQWDENVYTLRGENNQPRESYNQIPQFIHQVTNDIRMNMGETRFIPANDGSKDIAQVYEDLTRNIQSSTEAEVAYDAAADNQVSIGWGYWRYITDYENEKTFDQIIKYRWVPNAFTVYDDPACVQQDRLDRRYLIEVSDIPVKEFNRDYDRRYDSEDLHSIGDASPDWASGWDKEDEGMIRIAEYWEVTETKKKLFRHKKTGEITDKKPRGDHDEREVLVPKVTWRKCTAIEVLEEKEWPGIYIPYVFVAGEQINIDGKWYLSGLIEHMMSAQRQYNYWTNAATEMVSLMSWAPYMVDPEQIPGAYQTIWDNMNVKKYPYVPYRRFGKNGQDYGQPARSNNTADISSAVQLITQSQNNFYVTSGIYPASLGKQGNETSGKAIQFRQKEGDVSNFHFADNLSRGQRAGGRILADLIPKIYDGARVIRLLGEDKMNTEMPINQPYIDQKTGQLKMIDLTLGTYDVMVTTGANFTTKREEEQDALLTLAQSTNLMEVAPDIFYAKQDWSGAQELSDRYKKTLPPGLADDGPQGLPPQVQAQMQQQGQAIQMLTQKLQQAEQQLQDKQTEFQLKAAELQIKQQDGQAKAQTDAVKAQNDRLQTQLDVVKVQLEGQEVQVEKMKLALETTRMQYDAALQAAQQKNDQTEMIISNLVALQNRMNSAKVVN